MSEEQKQYFVERYRQLSDEELIERQRKGNLAEAASGALALVLAERSISAERSVEISQLLAAEDVAEAPYKDLAKLSERLAGQVLDNIVAILLAAMCFFVCTRFLSANVAGYASVLVWLGYHLFSDGIDKGQSIGKKLMKIAVVTTRDGRPCGFGRSFVRNVPLLILGLLDWMFILGKERRRLGDHLADTRVIRLPSPQR